MMNPGFSEFLAADARDRRDVFLGAAARLGTPEQNIEKDFWVCWTLDALFNGLAAGSPRLLFKGGTSLSKAYGLISRFSEDIDVTVYRDDLGHAVSPVELEGLSRKKREVKLDAIKDACRDYIRNSLYRELGGLVQNALRETGIDDDVSGVALDGEDPDGQSLLFWYPSVTAGADSYIRPAVKIESGAKSAYEPHRALSILPYIAADVPRISFDVAGITTVIAERTFWDKVVILHGVRSWFNKRGVLRYQGQRVSRHYYDVHRMLRSRTMADAIRDRALAGDCVRHARMFFGSPDLGLDTAVHGTFTLMPSEGMTANPRRDYDRMAGMIIGTVPRFDAVMRSIQELENQVNA